MQHQQYRPPLVVSIITPPYAALGCAVDVDRIRPGDLCPGTIFGLAVCERANSLDLDALKSSVLHIRQRHPAVPIVLRLGRAFDAEAAHLVQVATQLHVRGVLVDGDPVRETLCRFLTEPVDLPADVAEWFSLRQPAMPPQLADLIRKIFLHGPSRRAEKTLFSAIGESTRTARARCHKLALPPPSGWLQAARGVHAALRIQRAQSTPLLELAMDLGYSDHSALSHQLVRLFGAPASVIRRTLGWEWLLDSWLTRWAERSAQRS